jgi:hypothetical protein
MPRLTGGLDQGMAYECSHDANALGGMDPAKVSDWGARPRNADTEMTRRTNPRIRELAEQLIAFEGASETAATASLPVVSRVVEKLRGPLGKLAGIEGFRALLTRALMLAKAQIPGLGAIHINPDATLEDVRGLGNQEQVEEAGLILIAELLELLSLLIGETLTFTLVRDVWPAFSRN